MIGIYKITNLITGRIYIGQSKNIKRRFTDHITPSHISEPIDKNISFYGRDKFLYEVLEECTLEELDEKEDYYIKLYRSQNIPMYNKLDGGQASGFRCGENNGNAKLNDQIVYEIREAYKNHESRKEVYERYKYTGISHYTFESLWQGQYWQNVHMDVYTQENLDFHRGKKFTDEEVMELRQRYITETPEEIYESVKDKCSLFGLKKVLYGQTYKYLPVYKKATGQWVNLDSKNN